MNIDILNVAGTFCADCFINIIKLRSFANNTHPLISAKMPNTAGYYKSHYSICSPLTWLWAAANLVAYVSRTENVF